MQTAVETVSYFHGTFWALVPSVVAIVLALITKEAYSSLFIGVVLGALLASKGAPIQALNYVIDDGLTVAIADNAGIFLFLVLLRRKQLLPDAA